MGSHGVTWRGDEPVPEKARTTHTQRGGQRGGRGVLTQAVGVGVACPGRVRGPGAGGPGVRRVGRGKVGRA
eukprot:3138929-Prymnesium_polylepis.1